MPRPASRWKTRVLLPAVVMALAGGMVLYTAREALMPAVAVEVAPVVARAVEGGERGSAGEAAVWQGGSGGGGGGGGGVIAQAAGWIEPDPFAVNVSALAEGVVRDVLVLEGDRVEAGQVVARMVDDEARLALRSAEAEVAQRRAELAMAEAELAAAETEWANPVERRRAVNAAEGALAGARAELAKFPAELAAEEARLEEVRDELERKRRLSESGVVSRGELARLERRAAAQGAAVEALRGMRPVLEAKVLQAEAEVEGAREGMRLRIGETRGLAASRAAVEMARGAVARAEAMRDEAALRLERMEIRAPAAGVVLSRLAAPGTRLMPGGGDSSLGEIVRGDSPTTGGYAMRLYDPARVQVRVDVPLADAGKLSVGQGAEVTVEVLPGRTMRGRVTRILGEANIQKNTLQVKVAILDPDPRLRPEMLARVKLVGGGEEVGEGGSTDRSGQRSVARGGGGERLFVPRGAVGEVSGGKARVWVADRGTRAARAREVSVGTGEMEGWVEVTEGLRHGDLVIVGDRSGLKEGTRVRIAAGAPGTAGGAGSHGGMHR